MNDAKSVASPKNDRLIEVSEADLKAAWAVLENLAVSIDQMGGFFGDSTKPVGGERPPALVDALSSYLSKDLIQSISEARTRLARYLPDTEAEDLADSIPYWDYAGTRA